MERTTVRVDPRVAGFLGRILDDVDNPIGTCFQMTPDVLVTAWHILDDLGADVINAAVRLDPLQGGPPRDARVMRIDPLHDLAVLVTSEPLMGCVAGLAASDEVIPTAPISITGVVRVDDPGHSYRYLDADGRWAGGTTRDDEVGLSRVVADGVMKGMSGAPVLVGQVVVGVVSGRYNSTDGWLRNSVWVSRTENLIPLLAGLTSNVAIVKIREAAPATSSPKPDELPNDINDFTGRLGELDTLRTLLRHRFDPYGPACILAVCGKPGVGKSALATHFAHEVASHYVDGRLYGRLRRAEGNTAESQGEPVPVREVLDGFLRAFGVTDHNPLDVDRMATRYRSILATKRVLVLLDDAVSAQQVRPLLPASPTCLALLTSRRCFHSMEGTLSVKLGDMEPDQGVRLLARLIGEDRVASAHQSAEELVRLCGYLPLAIRLTAARLQSEPDWPIDYLVRRLADERRRLNQLRDEDLDVRASFQVSYQDLPEPVQRTFRMLGLFTSHDFTAEVAAVLIGDHPDDVQDRLDRLVRDQLLEPVRAPGRYQLHDLLRLFARELSAAQASDTERGDALARVGDWYVAVAGAADRVINPVRPQTDQDSDRFPTHDAALSWFDQERDNLLAVFRQADQDGQSPVVWQLAVAMAYYFELKNAWLNWQETHERALVATRSARDRAAEAWILISLGAAYRYQQRYDDAVNSYQQSLAITHELDDRFAEAWALLGLDVTDDSRHRHAAAFEASLEIFRQLGDRFGEAWAMAWKAKGLRGRHRFDEALADQEEALLRFREAGDRHAEAWILDNLGSTYYEMERLDEALDLETRALELFRATGNRHEQAWVLNNIGHVHRKAARFDQAIHSYQQALTLCREIRDRGSEAETLNLLAAAWRDVGYFDAAISAHEQAAAVHRDLADTGGEGRTLNVLARTLRAQGRLDRAVETHNQAVAILRTDQPAFRDSEAWVLRELGDTYQAQGRVDEAVETYKESLALYKKLSDQYHQAKALERLGDAMQRLRGTRSGLPYWRDALAIFDGRHDPEATGLRRKIEQAGAGG